MKIWGQHYLFIFDPRYMISKIWRQLILNLKIHNVPLCAGSTIWEGFWAVLNDIYYDLSLPLLTHTTTQRMEIWMFVSFEFYSCKIIRIIQSSPFQTFIDFRNNIIIFIIIIMQYVAKNNYFIICWKDIPYIQSVFVSIYIC